MQRAASKHGVALGEDKISLRSLVAYLKDAKDALEDVEGDGAFYMEMLVTYFTEDYSPSKPLKFAPKHLGL